jgi:3-oxoacyl-[acyl-carrier-protein] synthase-3
VRDGPGARITGLGEYRPARIVTNNEIAEAAGLKEDWIRTRMGIRERRHAGPEETIPAMALAAGKLAVSDAAVAADQIDLVIVATSTARRTIPGTAAEVAAQIGATRAGTFDINAVCAGFTYALSTAADAIRLGNARNALVIGSERLSDWIDPSIPDTFAIFGDGAAGAVVSLADEDWIGPPVWGNDGGQHSVIEIPADGRWIQMTGRLVYKWAVTTMPGVARLACERSGLDISEIDWLVLHQANERIINGIALALGIPESKIVSIISDTGNTSASSVPAALARLRHAGRATTGDYALLVGYGAGLTFAAQVVRLP